jgi:WD40 repeat protein
LFTENLENCVKLWCVRTGFLHSFNEVLLSKFIIDHASQGKLYCLIDEASDYAYKNKTFVCLQSAILAAGWTKYVTIFRLNTFRDTHVQADDWKGGQAHTDDILCLAASFGIMASASYSGEIIIWNLSSEQCTRQLSQRVYKKISTSKRGVKNGVTASQAATRENTMMSTASGTAEPTEDAASAAGSQQPRARSGIARLRPQSSNLSAAVLTLNGEDDPLGGGGAEGGAAVTRLIFLDARRTTVSHSGGVNLVSCGGNGWVRFWNTTECTLLGEFVAHERAGSIIMAVLLSPDGAGSGNSDGGRRWLATGDVDGFVRTWDISAHCTQAVTEIVKTSPPVIAQFQAHRDMVTSMEMFERNRCVLLLTSSCDCSVSLWDISGRPIGTFGQEMHWKIEPYVAPATTHEDEAVVSESHSRRGVTPDDWKPDDLAIVDPKSYRFNTWQESILGKNYQELRTQKRERKQPGNIEEQPIAGPFAALNISNLSHIENPQKPENLRSLDRMMDEKQTGDDVVEGKMPTFADTLNAVFDEKNFFPKYILDYEAKMKSQHARILLNEQKKAGESLKAALFQGQGAGEGAGGSTKTFNSKAGGAPYRHSNVKIH